MAENSKNTQFIQGVKLISVPTFTSSKSIVLLDMSTLQSYEVKFDLSEGVMPAKDSALENVAAGYENMELI